MLPPWKHSRSGGRGSEQPDGVQDGPAHGRGLDQMTCKGPFQPKLFSEEPSQALYFSASQLERAA